MAIKNNILKTVQSVTSRPKNEENSSNGKRLAQGVAKGVAGRAAGAAALPFAKWIAIGAIIAVVLVLLGGLGNGGMNVAKNAAPLSDCQPTADKNELISGLEGSGQTLTPEERKAIMDVDQSGSCKKSGVGFTGEAYPPTAGRITTFFAVVDALHPNGHNGMDIAASCESPIYAFAGGTVISVSMGTEAKSTAGNYVWPPGDIVIQHTEEFKTRYHHLKGSTTKVKVGDVVSAGDEIAAQWSNGTSTGCHLHIEAYLNGERKDMNDYLKACGFEYSESSSFNAFPPAPVQCGGGGVDSGAGSGTGIKNYAKIQMQAINGVSSSAAESEFQCLDKLWNRESNWNPTAINPAFAPSKAPIPENQAYGIPQGAPGSKMASAGADWKTNPETQVRWGLGYIAGRYGTPCGAWAHSEANNWY
jgi:hypothetical protein